MQTDTNGEILQEGEPVNADTVPADNAEVRQPAAEAGDSPETTETIEIRQTPEGTDQAEEATAAPEQPAPETAAELQPAADDEPSIDDDPDHSEIRTRTPELEEETGSDLQPVSPDQSGAEPSPEAEGNGEEFAPITELEYLPPSKKEGEEEENLPRFASVAEARAALEGFLFTTNEPLSVQRLSKLCGNLHPRIVRGLLLELQMEYDGRPGGLQIVEVAGGFQMATRPHIAEWMFRLHKHRKKSALSPATLETLAIIAYKQPITKGEIEAIRGVESSGTIRTLQDLNLIDVGGRREVPGRPQLYVTTPQFLKAFGLNSLADLPSISELRNRFADEQKLRAPLPAPVRPARPPEEDKPAAPPAESPVPEEEGAGEPTPDEATEVPAAEEEPVEQPAPVEPADEPAVEEPEDEPTGEEPVDEEEVVEDAPEEESEDDATSEEPPTSPEDDIPPPSSVPLGRVPKPPRKGGWGIGRPLIMDDDDG